MGSNVSRRALLAQAGSLVLVLPGAARAAQLKATQPLTMGPYYPLSKPGDQDTDLTSVKGHAQRALGEVIEVRGRILTPKGEGVPHARIEIWQANAAGKYFHPSDLNTAPLDPNFQGYAAFRADAAGRYRYLTVKPGAYPGPRGMRAPHIHLDVDGRVDRLVTQMFFPGEPLNATDVVMRDVDNPSQAIATQAGFSATGIRWFNWDVVLHTG
jgi:protocatechuate 3,4-dioxygenase beta subunit